MSVKVRRFTRFSVGVSLSMTGQSPAVSAGVPGTSGHGVVRHQRSEWCGQKPVNDMLYIKRRSLRHVNLPGGRCNQRACLSGQGQANTTHLPVSPSVTGKNDPGIGGRSQCEAGGRQGEAETVTVHAQRFQEDLSPCRTPAAGE
ncbi:hypothetical protein ECZU06_60580 [Escherichia coli]|nr:hypothetical protein ECZU06_60580 [Escherichia coli]